MPEEVKQVEEQIDESTQETLTSTQTQTEEIKSSSIQENMVPQSRFNEVISKKNSLQDRVNELETQIQEGTNSANQTQEKISTLNDTIEDLKNQLIQSNHNLWKTQAAVKHRIPDDFRDRIQGTTEEEIFADAETMAKSFPKKKVDVDNKSSQQGNVLTDDKKTFIERQYGVKLGE